MWVNGKITMPSLYINKSFEKRSNQRRHYNPNLRTEFSLVKTIRGTDLAKQPAKNSKLSKNHFLTFKACLSCCRGLRMTPEGPLSQIHLLKAEATSFPAIKKPSLPNLVNGAWSISIALLWMGKFMTNWRCCLMPFNSCYPLSFNLPTCWYHFSSSMVYGSLSKSK